MGRQASLLTQYIIEREGLPSDWRWSSFKVLDHKGKEPKDWRFSQYDGAVYPHTISRGPRKGRPNFRKPMPGTERTCIVDDREFRSWLISWERRTGQCSKCVGTGEQWAGWSAEHGEKFKTCTQCNGSGEATERTTHD